MGGAVPRPFTPRSICPCHPPCLLLVSARPPRPSPLLHGPALPCSPRAQPAVDHAGSLICAGVMSRFRKPDTKGVKAQATLKQIASDMHVVTSDLMAGLGNTFSDFLGVALGTAALEIAKAGLGVEPTFWPLGAPPPAPRRPRPCGRLAPSSRVAPPILARPCRSPSPPRQPHPPTNAPTTHTTPHHPPPLPPDPPCARQT